MSLKDLSINKNPVLSFGLGLCPVFALTYRFDTAWIVGLITILIIFLGNVVLRLIKDTFTPKQFWHIRILILAFWITLIELLLGAYFPEIKESLGIYLPLLVVNTFILSLVVPTKEDIKQEGFQYMPYLVSYVLTLGFIGALREIVGFGTFTVLSVPGLTLRYSILQSPLQPIRFFLLPSGIFLLYGYLTAMVRWIQFREKKRVEE